MELTTIDGTSPKHAMPFVRVELVLLSVAAVFFAGVIVNRVLFGS